MMLIAVCVLALTGCGKKKEKLKLFLPGEYLGEDVISDFEKAIKDGKNGYLANPGEWYGKLEYLYKHPEDNKKISKA